MINHSALVVLLVLAAACGGSAESSGSDARSSASPVPSLDAGDVTACQRFGTAVQEPTQLIDKHLLNHEPIAPALLNVVLTRDAKALRAAGVSAADARLVGGMRATGDALDQLRTVIPTGRTSDTDIAAFTDTAQRTLDICNGAAS